MSKKKGLNRQLARYFEDHQGKITLDQVVQIIKKNPNNLCLVDNLISSVHFTIDRYQNYHNLKYIYQMSLLISEILQKEPHVQGLAIKLKRIYSKLESLELENSSFFRINQEENSWLEKSMKNIKELISKNKENSIPVSCYPLLEFIIVDLQDKMYLKRILNHFPDLVNSKSEDGESLFDHITLLFVDKILYERHLKQEEISYYFEVLSFIRNHSNFKSSDNPEVLKTINSKIKQTDQEKCKYLIDLENLWEGYKLDGFIPSNYKIHMDFSEVLIEELELYQTSISKMNDQDRVIIDDFVITIDEEESLELDDAFSIKKLKNGNILLGVHIASALSYLPFSSLLVDEAIQRGSTIYLRGDQALELCDMKKSFIPIFPESFSINQASLVENEPRYAKSYFFEFDSSGYLVNQKYLKTIITNRHQSSYQEINEIIECGSSNKKLQTVVHMLNHLTYLLEERMNAKDMCLDKEQNKINPAKLSFGNTRAERIVSTLMVLTGKNVASFFAHSKEGYPILYRVHEMNDLLYSKLSQEDHALKMKQNTQKIHLFYQKMLELYPSTYDIKGSHYGLSLDHYCHCTSPLRRGADLVVEHALDVCYFGNPSDCEIRELEELILSKKEIINEQNYHISLFLKSYHKNPQKTKNVKSG